MLLGCPIINENIKIHFKHESLKRNIVVIVNLRGLQNPVKLSNRVD